MRDTSVSMKMTSGANTIETIIIAVPSCPVSRDRLSLTSAVKKGWAYTVADITGSADADKIAKIDGVVKVRIL